MATVTSPLSHALGGAGFKDAGHRYNQFILGGNVLARLAESFSLRNLGMAIPFLADVAGSGSDTVRELYYDSIGSSAAMASMAAENTQITGSTVAAEVEDIAIGRYGLKYAMTYFNEITKQSGELSIEDMAALIAQSYEATWMDTVASVMAGFSGGVTATSVLTVDDFLDATFVFDLLEGGSEGLFALISGKQVSDLKTSWRSETGLQFPAEHKEILRQKGGPGLEIDIYGVLTYKSQRVTTAVGDKIGAMWQGGAMKWAIGGTAGLPVSSPEEKVTRLDPLGLIIEQGGASDTATNDVVANAWWGMDIQDDERGTRLESDA